MFKGQSKILFIAILAFCVESQAEVRRIVVQLEKPKKSLFSSDTVGQTVVSAKTMDNFEDVIGAKVKYVRRLYGDHHIIELPEDVTDEEAKVIAALIAEEPNVEKAEADIRAYPLRAPNDTLYADQWHYHEAIGGVNLPDAWELTVGHASIRIAVIDTGILSHTDLNGKLASGYDFISDSDTANDGDGRDSDPTDPGDADGVNASSWHGTHVAGTVAAASNNGSGVAGINWVSQIVPVRVLGVGGGSFTDIVDGMRWAAGLSVSGVPDNPNPAQILNLSLGGSGACPGFVQTAIDEIVAEGVTVVVAAGNSNVNASGATPANCNNVITVAATTRTGARASYSNFGATVEIAAPGGSGPLSTNGVISTLDGGTTSALNNNTYAGYQGTSMATPHVAGIVSLMYSVNPDLTPAEVLSAIQATARTFATSTGNDCTTATCGSGIIDAEAAVGRVSRILSANTDEVDFGSRSVGIQSSGQVITFTNQNQASTSLSVSAVSLAGTNPSEFVITSDTCSSQTIAAGGTCSVTVAFNPTSDLGKTAVLQIASDAAFSPGEVELSGTGGASSEVNIGEMDLEATEENTDKAKVIFQRSNANNLSALTINYSLSGTAVSGLDFEPLSGSLTFEAGLSTAVLTIIPIADSESEEDETVIVTLISGSGYEVGANSQVTVSLSDKAKTKADEASSCLLENLFSSTGMDSSVEFARSFRDSEMRNTWLGNSLIRLYYTYSPVVVAEVRRDPLLRQLSRLALVPTLKIVEWYYGS